ncbi:hypothetical protein RRG08_028396 [Elysia crispata]|uniref:Coiled-coil domain-containing protein 13 n=1 Tax=Elysia crispata TaxID=231223 RepID=A0AAE1CRT1_9GAST|nr:hypothetical protein RRG08_028396 [Elysia crispata]
MLSFEILTNAFSDISSGILPHHRQDHGSLVVIVSQVSGGGMETKELKDQFQELQAQQQKKLMERRRKKELAAKNENKNNDALEISSGKFGINDDMNLKLSDPANKGYSYLSEELVDHLNVQIREMKDENGRLYKLLSERDFEIRQLKKKAEDTKHSSLSETVTNETAATKIIELSRKVRELTAEKESERTKCRQLQKKIHDLQLKSQATSSSEPPSNMGSMISLRSQISENRGSEDATGVDVKALQDRLKQTEARCTDFRNQCQSLRQELKVANKVLGQEIGENVNIQSLLNETSNWRGRAQQIIALQQKVDELKVQLDSQGNDAGSLMGQPEKGSSGRRKQEERYREELKRLERERKEAQESTLSKLKGLEEENKSLRDKIDAAKVRNKVLSNDIKQQKAQVQTLLKKSRNDDEFIDALMKQQGQLKKLLDDSSSHQNQQTMAAHLQLQQMSMKSQQDSNVVEQLKAIAAQKEAQVKMLEMELQNLRGVAAKNYPASAVTAYMSSPEQSTVLDGGGDVEVEVTINDRPFSGQSNGRTLTSRNESQSAMSMTQLSSRSQSRMSSATLVRNSKQPDTQELSELRYRCEEVEIMCRATEVERDKMSELVQVLQLRLAEETDKLNEANSQVQVLKRATVELEKRLAKQALDAGAKRKGTAKGGPAPPSTVDAEQEDEESNVEKEELLTKLEIQMDETAALKAALQRTVKAKDEDMKIYSSTLDQTKQVFLQALRQMKDKHMA